MVTVPKPLMLVRLIASENAPSPIVSTPFRYKSLKAEQSANELIPISSIPLGITMLFSYGVSPMMVLDKFVQALNALSGIFVIPHIFSVLICPVLPSVSLVSPTISNVVAAAHP